MTIDEKQVREILKEFKIKLPDYAFANLIIAMSEIKDVAEKCGVDLCELIACLTFCYEE